MKEQFEVIVRKVWYHGPTGKRASVYGANPFWGKNDGTWAVIRDGYTIRDNRTQEIGRPYGLTMIDRNDREAVQALATKLNDHMNSIPAGV